MLIPRHLIALFLIAILLLVALPTTAAPNCPGELDEKSRLRLMPAACGPAASEGMASLAQASMFGAVVEAQVSSWPQVLAAVNLDGVPGAELPLLTDEYFAPATDKALVVYGMSGPTLVRDQQLPAGAAPAAIIAGELAGGPGIVAALAGDNTLAVYTGTLPLGEALTLDMPGAPDAVALGDFNDDLRSDIAAVSPEADTIHLRDGDRVGFPSLGAIPFPTDGFSALRVGDLDNDGYDDLVALRGAGYQSESVTIFFQNQDVFTRTFALSPATGGFLPHSLAVGDLSGDGRDDIAVVAGGNAPNAFLSLYIQTDDGFTVLPPIPTFHIPGAVAIADVTHDGRADVLVFHHTWRTLSIYVQQPGGSLATPETTTIPYSGARRPDSMVVADVSGDGGLDVALASRTPGLTVLPNTGGAPTATITAPEPYSIVASGTAVVSGTVSAGTTRVEVRAKGLTGWVDATITGSTWEAELELPDVQRPVWIEARATDAAGRVQAPPSQVRVRIGPSYVGYAVADNGRAPGSVDRLVRFDPTTGAAKLVGPTGTTEIHSLAYLPGQRQLVAANHDRLGTVDMGTGVFTPLPQRFGEGRNGSQQVRFSNAQGLALDPADGHLFAVMRRGNGAQDLLFKLNAQTGARVANAFGSGRDFVRINTPSALDDVDDLAYDAYSRTLYAAINQDSRNDHLATIDTTTGAVTVIGPLKVNNVEGLALSPDGTLYGSTGTTANRSPTGDRLWAIDQASGEAALVGPFGIESDYESLAIVPGADAPRPARSPLGAITVDGVTHSTAEPTVRLRGATAAIGTVVLAGHRYDQARGSWIITPGSTSLAATETPAESLALGLDWPLDPTPGVHYVLAWPVGADGEAAPVAEQIMINYNPPRVTVAPGAPVVYRFTLAAGERLDLALEALSGAARLVVWSSDAEVSPVTATGRLSVTAEDDALYQVEIHAPQGATVQLGASVVAADAPGVAPASTASLPIPAQPAIPLDSVPDLYRAPTPSTSMLLYLPLLRR